MAFALLEGSSKHCYKNAFRSFKALFADFKPTVGHTDFEEDLVRAFLEEFDSENFKLALCWAHFKDVSDFDT